MADQHLLRCQSRQLDFDKAASLRAPYREPQRKHFNDQSETSMGSASTMPVTASTSVWTVAGKRDAEEYDRRVNKHAKRDAAVYTNADGPVTRPADNHQETQRSSSWELRKRLVDSSSQTIETRRSKRQHVIQSSSRSREERWTGQGSTREPRKHVQPRRIDDLGEAEVREIRSSLLFGNIVSTRR